MLASRFHRPVPILAGILVAVVLNHATAALLGYFVGIKLNGPWMRYIIAASFFAVALWAVLPGEARGRAAGAKPSRRFRRDAVHVLYRRAGGQDADRDGGARRTVPRLGPGADRHDPAMMAANVPAVLLGRQLSRWVSLSALRWGAVAISVAMGIATLMSAE